MEGVNAELLSLEGMAEARALLISKHEWFLHAAPMATFAQIQCEGLCPHNPGAMPDSVTAAALPVARPDRIVCLRPIRTPDTTPRRGPEFMLALPASALPQTVTLDWSFGGVWTLPAIIKADAPAMTAAEIFCQIARRRGSVAIYEAIPPEALRVWTHNLGADPSAWPRLPDVASGDMLEIGIDAFG